MPKNEDVAIRVDKNDIAYPARLIFRRMLADSVKMPGKPLGKGSSLFELQIQGIHIVNHYVYSAPHV